MIRHCIRLPRTLARDPALPVWHGLRTALWTYPRFEKVDEDAREETIPKWITLPANVDEALRELLKGDAAELRRVLRHAVRLAAHKHKGTIDPPTVNLDWLFGSHAALHLSCTTSLSPAANQYRGVVAGGRKTESRGSNLR